MSRLLKLFSRYERQALALLLVAFLISGAFLLRKFYYSSTVLVPDQGGTYIEGSVGELQPLMPWFTVENDVNRDIVSLVYSGLQKYNPETGNIEDDLGTLEVSANNKIYTVTLKEGLQWHDSTEQDPHYVTADDVVFTFSSIQQEGFPNSLLQQNFLGVAIEKVDDRTVRFTLDNPYRFFASNLTLGLLPKRSFEGVPASSLDQVLDIGFAPIGAGPYAFKGLVQTDLSVELTLERFNRPIKPFYHLERVVFRIFPDYNTLLSDIRNLDGVRLVPRNSDGEPIIHRSFNTTSYNLPQYVALFYNLEKDILEEKQLRLGLQLGTNKAALADAINETIIVDTPLLEIDDEDWRYKYDPEQAQGALFSTNWNLPEKVKLQRLLEMRDANRAGVLQSTPVAYLDTGSSLIITGSLLKITLDTTVNGIPIKQTSTGSWQVEIPTDGSTGSLALGFNIIRLEDPTNDVLDSFYLWRTDETELYRRASVEQSVLEQFVLSRRDDTPPEQRITVQDMYLDKGYLRKRLPSDPTDIRINEAGERLSLRLVTSNSPAHYRDIAEEIKRQWGLLGVQVEVEIPESRSEFEDKLINRDYDIVLFGQSLLDNLDSYPYWHSSGLQQFTGKRSDLRLDAYNLSQYSSFESDSLLETIRETSNEKEVFESLNELREIMKQDVPAVFLYSPLYTYAHSTNLKGIELGKPSLHSDRFLTLHRWYLKEDRVFKPGKSWLSLISWLFGRE